MTALPEQVRGDMLRLARVTEHASTGIDELARLPLLPPTVHAEGTLRRFYESALVLFGQTGFHAVSVRDIARAVGVQASSLYAHVPSKQHLLADLVRFGHAEHCAGLRLCLLDTGSDPVDQLKALTRQHVRFHTSYPLLARVCNRELAGVADDRRADIVALRVEAERLFFDVVERGQRIGTFRAGDPTLGVAAIGSMGIRLAEWWYPGVGIAVDEIADTYADFAVRMFA